MLLKNSNKSKLLKKGYKYKIKAFFQYWQIKGFIHSVSNYS